MTGEIVDFPGSRVDVASTQGSYPVFVGPGVLEGLPNLLQACTDADRFVVITDDNVGPLHGESVAAACRSDGLDVTYLTFPAGEASKTRRSWSILTDEMLEAEFGRDSCVVAIGGGVTTDLGGFVAATYLRGVALVQVPTSYLAMIDASVGGKTGVDVHAGKNLVGAFHAPKAVLADTRVLSTLPREERAQGLVEALKHGAILDEEYFSLLSERLPDLLDGDPDVAGAAVLRSVALKSRVVGQDEFEGGYRQILNFGHTIGHAIEAASNYTVGHGTAVALGMVAEAAIGERIGVTDAGTCDRLERALRPLVPAETRGVQPEEALEFLRTDKKARRGRPRFVLLKGIGEVDRGEMWSQEVSSEVVHDAMNRVLDRP